MKLSITCNDNGNDTVTVLYSDTGGEVVRTSRTKRHAWRGNNRRTDHWFIHRGVNYHGWCDESRTIFQAYALKEKPKASPLLGRSIEIPVHFDLWMMGARYGHITSVTKDGALKVKMMNSRVRRLVTIQPSDIDYCKIGELARLYSEQF